MKNLLLITALLTSGAFAGEAGEELHAEACLGCHMITHDAAFYTRDNSRLSNHFDLRRQVSTCATNFGVDWFPEEEAQVVDFLNTQYYQFDN
jgi:hypothetical protein